MSSNTQPTDPSEGCNELSTQNGRATTPVTELETQLPVANERSKTTSRSGRTVRLSTKAQALANDKDARSASKVSSNADRIKGRRLGEQVSQCDFENIASINTCFPCHKGKGTQDIPLGMLSFCATDMAKGRKVREWRMHSDRQQLQIIAGFEASEEREEQAAEKARADVDSSRRAGTGKRKRSGGSKQPEDEKKKRKKTKEKTDEQKKQSAERKRARGDKRNKTKKDQRAAEREARLENDNISGLLVDSQNAAANSSSAKALISSKQRQVETRPKSLAQMNDKTAVRKEEESFMGVIKFSEHNALTNDAAAKYGADLMNTQAVISFNNTEHLRTHRLGGQSKSDGTVANEPPPPTINIGMYKGEEGWDKLVERLAEAGALEAARKIFTTEQPVPQPQNPHVTFIGSIREASAHYSAKKESRKRATKVQTTEEVISQLGPAVRTQTRPLQPRN